MRLKLAEAIIKGRPVSGFMVHCQKRSGLITEYFPDTGYGEELIKTEEEAWDLARLFAEKTRGLYINVYVVDSNLIPVDQKKIINAG